MTTLARDTLAIRRMYWQRSTAEALRRIRWRIGEAAPGPSPPSRPIFVLGCPRSGTTLLFALLRQHSGVRSFHEEGHALWNAYQHPRLKGWTSDRATAEHVQRGEAHFVYSVVDNTVGGPRFLDKTPKNVLKIPYLIRLFPDAFFVFLKRNGRDTVSSLIEGWLARRGVSYRLPVSLSLDAYRGRFWSYVLPPGWRDKANTTIAEVTALQYVACNETALADRGLVPADSFIEVGFEDLLARPAVVTNYLLERLELGRSEAISSMAKDLASHQVGTISPPRPGKWRDRAADIERVAPTLAPTMHRLGYELEAG